MDQLEILSLIEASKTDLKFMMMKYLYAKEKLIEMILEFTSKLDPKQMEILLSIYNEKEQEIWLEEFEDFVNTRISKIEELEQEYIKTGRNVDHPTAQDLNWIKSHVKKLVGLSANGFIKKYKK